MKLVPTVVTRSIGRQILTTKKNSPHIFFVAGLVGAVGATVLACRATLRLEETVDEIKVDLDAVKEMGKTTAIAKTAPWYNDREYVKDLVFVYTKASVKVGTLYGPAIALGTVSVAALTGSHIQLARRNTALTATVALVSKAFEEYRGRVREELGIDRELDLYRNVHQEMVEIDGKKQLVKVVDPNGLSMYARIFDEVSPNWKKNAELNRIFLQCQQNYANHRLHAIGHVFLNEIYDSLGFERTSAGQVVGWYLDEEGDGYVDFGLFEARSSQFLDGHEPRIILDFNVDGVIYNKL